MRRTAFQRFVSLVFVASLLAFAGCVGGPHGTPAEKRAYFEKLEHETLERLQREHPPSADELKSAAGYAVIEEKIVKVPVFGAGSGAGVVVDKATGTRSYLHVPELQFGAGWGERVERVVIVFQDAAKLRDLANGEWHAGIAAEAAVKAGDVGAAGGASRAQAKSKSEGFHVYVLTAEGVSASVTLEVIRAQPFKIE